MIDRSPRVSSSADCSKRIVAVVDDDANTVEVIQAILEYDGYDVQPFSDGPGALQGVAVTRPHLVVLDMVLRGSNGGEVLESLKSDPATASIPVIVCTAATLPPANLERLEHLGCVFLPKPFDMDAFLHAVRKLTQ